MAEEDDPPKTPDADAPAIVKSCDDPAWTPDPNGRGPKTREECRKLAEGIHCTNPLTRTAWCAKQQERRARDRQILIAMAAVLVAMVYLSD
jgi:hypothetical protein